MENGIVKAEFLNMEDFGKMQQVAEFFVKSDALPKGVDNAGKLVMIMQAGRDIGLSVTQAMSGLAIINGVVTAYGSVAAVLMKRAGRNWTVEPTEKILGPSAEKDAEGKPLKMDAVKDLVKKIKIWKGEKEKDEEKAQVVEYRYSEAQKAGIAGSIPWVKYTDDMLYWKCLARARKQICPEVLDGVAIYEDYQELEKTKQEPTTGGTAIDGEIIDGDIIESLAMRIENSSSLDELKGLLDEVRKSGDPKMVTVYANKAKTFTIETTATDAKGTTDAGGSENTITEGPDASGKAIVGEVEQGEGGTAESENKDPATISEQVINVG